MKLELLDTYGIRARLSAHIIILSPLAITLFLCFDEVFSIVSSAVIVAILLAFTNFLPILQRQIYQNHLPFTNYAAQFLMPSDGTLNPITKSRYYRTLAALDPAFSCFTSPIESDISYNCCESAVRYLRNKSRQNPFILEENINYGFYRNLFSNKEIGLSLCTILGAFIATFSLAHYGSFTGIPISNYLALIFNVLLFVFWLFCVNQNTLESTAKQYAKALLSSIDSL